jgi:hypothetical protein
LFCWWHIKGAVKTHLLDIKLSIGVYNVKIAQGESNVLTQHPFQMDNLSLKPQEIEDPDTIPLSATFTLRQEKEGKLFVI